MADEASEVPAGAAVFPLIPEELGIHPLLLAVLHSLVFIEGSRAEVVNPAAGEEALNYLVTYLQRLGGSQLQRLREDMECLLGFAHQQQWPPEEMEFLKSFLTDYGIGEEEES